jgi:hypothetical protein
MKPDATIEKLLDVQFEQWCKDFPPLLVLENLCAFLARESYDAETITGGPLRDGSDFANWLSDIALMAKITRNKLSQSKQPTPAVSGKSGRGVLAGEEP